MFKKFFISFFIILFFLSISNLFCNTVRQKGYYDQYGNYHAAHWRSRPNQYEYDMNPNSFEYMHR